MQLLSESRPITRAEGLVIRAALQRARILEIDDALLDSLDQLQVIGVCGCGCASINFREGAREDSSTLLCDGIGTTPSGGGVGVIVWGVRDAITSLEVYDLGAGEDDISLPLPDSVRAWGPTERGGGG